MAQMASTNPNGHAPCRNPYADPSRQDAENAKTNQELRFSKAYVTSIAVTANNPKSDSGLIIQAVARGMDLFNWVVIPPSMARKL